MKRFCAVLFFMFINAIVFAQTVLAPGDIAFTGVNMDNPDQFSFVFLVDIQNGTEIKFSDNGWKSDDTWRGGEGTQTWTADRAYTKGEEIVIDANGPSLSASGDQLIAYQNDSDMIAAINDKDHHIWQDEATSSNTSTLPKDLINGTTCVALEETDNIKYNRSVTSGTKEELLAAINDWENWSGHNSNRQELSTDGFTVNDTTLPVELSSFNAIQSGENSVKIEWVTQSETDLLGYNILRNTSADEETSQKINPLIISSHNSPTTTNYEFQDEDNFDQTKYFYWLESVDLSGISERFCPISVTLSTPGGNINGSQGGIISTKLKNNFPNPFNPETTISFTLNESKLTEINIYNIRGELIKNLYHGFADKGENQINWNGKNNNDKEVAGGIYFYKMKTADYYSIHRMILLK